MDCLAMTDHGNINGAMNFLEQCEQNKIKAIIGCEMYVAKNMFDKDRDNQHIILLAKNRQGYSNLCKLVSESNLYGKYYKPRVDYECIKKYHKDLICLTACTSGILSKPFLIDDEQTMYNNLAKYRELFGEDFYLEIMPLNMEIQTKINRKMLELGNRFSIKVVATNDCHYPHRGDNIYQEMLLCIGDKKKMTDPTRFKFDVDTLFLCSREQMIEMFQKHNQLSLPEVESAVDMSEEIVAKCESYSLRGYNISPKVEFLKGECATTQDKFLALLEEGMLSKGFTDKDNYRARLQEEVSQITDKGFIDYFLLVWDLIKWARSVGILVGPARGSSAGSLVCYLLDITKVDPIVHETLFYRFIDPNRNDLPDIDIDFQDDRRDEVRQYLITKYGENNVAKIGTFGKLKGKLILKDLGRIYNVPPEELNVVTKYIVERSSADSRASFTVEDTFLQFEQCKKFAEKYPHIVDAAKRMEGQIKQYGITAAGILITDKDISDYCPIEIRGKEKIQCIGYDWRNVGYMGLLKIDVLGLNFLTVINKTLEMLKAKGITVNLETIDLDIPEVYNMFNTEKCTGIFQFETFIMNKMVKEIQVDNFKELTAINALVRPGPFRSGSTGNYIAKKRGKKQITYIHPLIKKITQDTKGEILYQEQVMNLVREIGNFDWKDTNFIRKTMAKNQGQESMLRFKQKFIEGAVSNGMTEEQAAKVWDETSYHGAWSFNLSHSVSYSMLSYWCAWLKYFYRDEYLTCFINHTSDDKRKILGLRDLIESGYKLLPPKIEHCSDIITVEGKNIYLGLSSVKGMGEMVIKELLKTKGVQSINDFNDAISKRIVNSKIKKILINIGFLDCFGDKQFLDEFFGVVYKEEELAMSKQDWLYEHCSTLFCDNMLQQYEEFLNSKINVNTSFNTLFESDRSEESDQLGDHVLLKGVMSKINLKNKEEGKGEKSFAGRADIEADLAQRYCVCDFFDGTDYSRISFYPDIYRKYEKSIWNSKNDAPIIIYGRIGKDRIYVDRFINIKDWIADPATVDQEFAVMLEKGIKSKAELDKELESVIENIDKYFEVTFEKVKLHQSKRGVMVFARVLFESGLSKEVIIWSDAYVRWQQMIKEGNKAKIRFSRYDFKEGKFYMDTITGRMVQC